MYLFREPGDGARYFGNYRRLLRTADDIGTARPPDFRRMTWRRCEVYITANSDGKHQLQLDYRFFGALAPRDRVTFVRLKHRAAVQPKRRDARFDNATCELACLSVVRSSLPPATEIGFTATRAAQSFWRTWLECLSSAAPSSRRRKQTSG
jgi:hypothetical protein